MLPAKTDHFRGPNPVSEVKKRRIPKTKPDFLLSEEVLPVLAALPDRWRTLFATALYTGLRKGELLGLRKSSVDVENKLLTVAYSYGRDTTKGGHADVIPIASELVPYLREAITVGNDVPGVWWLHEVGPGPARAGLASSTPARGDRHRLAP